MVFVRKVPTASGATAVQVAERVSDSDRVLKHFGSAHSKAVLALLALKAQEWMHEGQGQLDLFPSARAADPVKPVVARQVSQLLWDVLSDAHCALGFDTLQDEAFKQLVLARIIQPASKAATERVLGQLGIPHASLRTIFRCLQHVVSEKYRDTLATMCFTHASSSGDVSLVLYDVTTPYFEAEKEDVCVRSGTPKSAE